MPRVLLVCGAALLLAPVVAPPFWVTLLNYIGLYSIVALGLVLLTGVAGQTSFGQAAFVGLGAYTTAYLSLNYPAVSPWLNLLVGIALTSVDRAVPGIHHAAHEGSLPAAGDDRLGHQPLLHLRQSGIPRRAHRPGRHSCAVVFRHRIAQRAALLLSDLGDRAGCACGRRATCSIRGPDGRSVRSRAAWRWPRPSASMPEGSRSWSSSMRRCLRASPDGCTRTLQRFVNPTPFGLNQGIEYLFMAVVGGAGSVWGAVVGATLITLLKQVLQDWLPHLLGRAGNFEVVVFGILMILLLQRTRDGVWPWLARALPQRKPPPVAEEPRCFRNGHAANAGPAARSSNVHASNSVGWSRSTIFPSRSRAARSSA